MAKSKSELKAKKSKPEQFIIKSGSHTRIENGERIKFECGDLISPTAEELKNFPLKFLSIVDFESLLEADEARKRRDRSLSKITFPPRVKKRGARDSEALKRQRRLLKMQHRGERRTFIS